MTGIPGGRSGYDGFGVYAARCGFPWEDDRDKAGNRCTNYAVCWDAEGRKACGMHSEHLARLTLTVPIRRKS